MKHLRTVFVIAAFVPFALDAASSHTSARRSTQATMQELSETAAGSLLKLGQFCAGLEPELVEWKAHPAYRRQCHIRVVRSANYGDFPAYDGYHFKQILRDYPGTPAAEEAAYALIYVITDITHNYSDPREEQRKLRTFLKRYPRTRHRKAIEKRIREIDKHPEIMD